MQPTSGDIADRDLYYEVNGVAKKFVSGESNEYFAFNGDILKVKEHAPVTRRFYLFAQSRYDGTVSARTEIIVQSKYINEIRNATIDSEGLITGLEGLYRRDTDQSDVTEIFVRVDHAIFGTVIHKTIATHDPTMRLQLYNPTLDGGFVIMYSVRFREEYSGGYNEYNYTLPNVNYFGGIKKAAAKQTVETYYNSVQFFDFSGSDPKKAFELSQRVKYTYVYGGGGMYGASFTVQADEVNGADICLHSVTLISSGTVIRVQNYGALNIRIVDEVTLYASKGASGKNGGDGIYSPATVTLTGDYLEVYGGSGGMGTDGADGVAGVDGGTNESGTNGTSGENGMDGGNGGTAIRCAILNVHTKSLYAQGGNGATGGNGGNGKNGGHGGDGQDGKPNGTYSKPGGNGGDGGNGGNGGNGGSGGHGICATINNYAGISINAIGGGGASGGMGGKAGYGGMGGIGGDRYWSDTKKDDGVDGRKGSMG
ncbi:MAG: hypothetical protein K2L51_01660, partial [Clostridiales bacterium]|nr:hypothetical protein [Clostridiales bacterium]